MKPLLPAPWTPEDTDIWLRWARRYGWRVYACFLANVQTTGDRRDAELMLRREGFRQQCANIRAPDMPPRLWWYFYGEGLM